MKKKPIFIIAAILVFCLVCSGILAGVGGFLYSSSPTVADALEKTAEEDNYKEVIKMTSKSGEDSFSSTSESQNVSKDKFYTISKSDFTSGQVDSSTSGIQSYESLKNGADYFTKTNATGDDSYGFYNKWTKYSSSDFDGESNNQYSSATLKEGFKNTEMDLNKKIPFGNGEVVYDIEKPNEFFNQFTKNIDPSSSNSPDSEVKLAKITLKASGGKIVSMKMYMEGKQGDTEITFEIEITLSDFGKQNIDSKIEETKGAEDFNMDFGQ